MEEIKIKYIGFKNKLKFNLKQDEKGNLIQGTIPVEEYTLQNESFEFEKITLTKIGKKEGDNVVISSYDPNGDERNLEFEFRHYSLADNEWYVVKISWKRERNFFSFISKEFDGDGYWEVEICLEDEKARKHLTDKRDKGTEASLELSQIFECSEKNLNQKVVEIIKGFKYTKVKNDLINLSLF